MHPLQSSPELDSLTAVIDHLDRDAGQESAINQQMAAVMLGRLQSGRAGAERTLGVLQVTSLPFAVIVDPGLGPPPPALAAGPAAGAAVAAGAAGAARPVAVGSCLHIPLLVLLFYMHAAHEFGGEPCTGASCSPTGTPTRLLICCLPPRSFSCPQAFAAAEAAYARALASVAKLTLCSEADGPSLRAALEQFSDLPMLMGTAHSSVSERLTEAIKGLQSLTTDLRAACEEVGHGAARAKREVDGSRQGLKAALK
jgi:hypothetical protein